MTGKIVKTEEIMGGKARIEDTRIRVIDIVGMYEDRSLSAEEIADRFDLELKDVYAALVYYYEHPKEIRRQLSEQRDVATA